MICNCVLIKREWENNPPDEIIQKKKKKEEKTQKLAEEKRAQLIASRNENAQKLLTQCGFRFFTKYYYQVKDLPFSNLFRSIVVD